MTSINCLSCNTESPLFIPPRGEYFLSDGRFGKGELSKYICPNCALAFTTDIKSIGQFHYKNDYILDESQEPTNIHTGQFRSDIICEQIGDLCSDYLKDRKCKVLDIGCGSGRLLEKISNNWDVTLAAGVEPNDKARNSLEKRGYTAYATLDDMDQESFDVVMAIAVLEHVVEPKTFMRELKRKLTENGLLVLAIPGRNIGSHDLWVADHLFHFSPHHLHWLARECGLKAYKALEADNPNTFSYFVFINNSAKELRPSDSHWVGTMTDKDKAVVEKACETIFAERDFIVGKLNDLSSFLESSSPLAVYGMGERFNFLASFEEFRNKLLSSVLIDDARCMPAAAEYGTEILRFNETSEAMRKTYKWLYTFNPPPNKIQSQNYMVF